MSLRPWSMRALAGWLPRQRHHSAPRARRRLPLDPPLWPRSGHRAQHDREQDPDRAHARTALRRGQGPPESVSSPAAPAPAKPRCSTCFPATSPNSSASSPSKTPPNCSSSRSTSCASKPALPTSKAKARSAAPAGHQQPAYASRPHRGRRGPRRRSLRHASGHEYRSRGFAHHRPRQLPARCPGSRRKHGLHGQPEHSRARRFAIRSPTPFMPSSRSRASRTVRAR